MVLQLWPLTLRTRPNPSALQLAELRIAPPGRTAGETAAALIFTLLSGRIAVSPTKPASATKPANSCCTVRLYELIYPRRKSVGQVLVPAPFGSGIDPELVFGNATRIVARPMGKVVVVPPGPNGPLALVPVRLISAGV